MWGGDLAVDSSNHYLYLHPDRLGGLMINDRQGVVLRLQTG